HTGSSSLGCDPPGCDLSRCDPSGCETSRCDLSGCDPSGCDPSGCETSRCDPSRCDPSGCDPSRCDPSRCDPSYLEAPHSSLAADGSGLPGGHRAASGGPSSCCDRRGERGCFPSRFCPWDPSPICLPPPHLVREPRSLATRAGTPPGAPRSPCGTSKVMGRGPWGWAGLRPHPRRSITELQVLTSPAGNLP
uniref:Uncharacterized protein n=1 Tax=Pseudonaja textilis TaxID=8673 RepID=A0A670ZHC9_PSETE